MNRAGTQNLVNFSLAVPLGKLELRPTPDRQWNLVAQEITVPDGPPVFMFNVVERESVPRNLKAEQAALGGTAGNDAASADGSAAGPAPAKAVKGKGSAPPLIDDKAFGVAMVASICNQAPLRPAFSCQLSATQWRAQPLWLDLQ